MANTEMESEVRDWISSCEGKFEYEKNEPERKFTIKACDSCEISFYVIYPATGTEWMIFSESESVRDCLTTSGILDFCQSSKQKTITDILNKFYPVIKHVIQTKPCVKKDEKSTNDDDDDDDADAADDEDEDADMYYCDPDNDAEEVVEKEEGDDEPENFFQGTGNPLATQRLIKDLKSMQGARKFGIEGTPRGDNLYVWDVKLTNLPDDTKLGKDLKEFARKHDREPVIYLEMQFPPDYPMSPPFVRVIRPRFQFLTGHVTIGGSICMEMLTRSGWRPTNDIESILVQIRSEIMSDTKARLDSNPDRAYSEADAKDAFSRMVDRYGWNK